MADSRGPVLFLFFSSLNSTFLQKKKSINNQQKGKNGVRASNPAINFPSTRKSRWWRKCVDFVLHELGMLLFFLSYEGFFFSFLFAWARATANKAKRVLQQHYTSAGRALCNRSVSRTATKKLACERLFKTSRNPCNAGKCARPFRRLGGACRNKTRKKKERKWAVHAIRCVSWDGDRVSVVQLKGFCRLFRYESPKSEETDGTIPDKRSTGWEAPSSI